MGSGREDKGGWFRLWQLRPWPPKWVGRTRNVFQIPHAGTLQWGRFRRVWGAGQGAGSGNLAGFPQKRETSYLKLNPHLRLNPRPERVLDLFHLGHQIRQLDQFLPRVPARDHHMLIGGFVAQHF